MRLTRPVTTSGLAALAVAAAVIGVQAQTPAGTPATPGADSGRAAEALAAAFKRADANGDGKLTREEAARLPAIADRFEAYDKDGDGVLTLEELSAGLGAR